MRSNGQTGIDEQDTAICPWCKKTTVIWWWFEVWIVVCEGFEDVFEGGWCGCRGADGETEAVGLVEVMVGILTDDYGFDGVERCMS